MQLKKGFTLAEILITIAIIGIVSVLTIPVLMTKYREKVTVNRLNVMYSKLAESFRRMINDNGEISLYSESYDETLKKLANLMPNYINNITPNGKNKTKYYPEIYYNIDGTEWNSFASFKRTSYSFQMPDGSIMYLARGTTVTSTFCTQNMALNNKSHGSYNGTCGTIYVDINGLKKPNKFGEDLFIFNIMIDGIIPKGNSRESIWTESFKDSCISCRDNIRCGTTCTGWIIENKNMDYLHCPDKLGWNKARRCK